MVKRLSGKKSLKKLGKGLPFKSDEPKDPPQLPRNMRAKQREWILSGLRSFGAPMALRREGGQEFLFCCRI